MTRRSDPPLPPRGPAFEGRPMLLEFDLDCGPLAGGHRFVARGLRDDGLQENPDDLGAQGARRVQYFSFEYELVPGVERQEPAESIWSYLVGIEYTADIELPWPPNDGGAIAPFTGGATTHGSRGSWPLLPGARQLVFTLYAVEPPSTFANTDPAGRVVVDLRAGTAHWEPG